MSLPILRVDFNDVPLTGEALEGVHVGGQVRLHDPDPTVPDAIGRVYEIVDGVIDGRWAHCRVVRWLDA